MNCEEHQETLSAFMDGMAEPHAASLALEHVGSCAGCRDFFASAMSHRSALRHAPMSEFPRTLDRRIRRATAPSRLRWRELMPLPVIPGWRVAIPLPALAVAVLYLLTATILALSSLFGSASGRTDERTFLYVRELPPVEVVGVSSNGSESKPERSVLQ